MQGSLIDFLVWMKLYVVARRPFHRSEDTRSCGEKASPLVVIDVVICSSGGYEGEKKPRVVLPINQLLRKFADISRGIFGQIRI